MKYNEIKKNARQIRIFDFDSLNDFYNYITTTDTNEAFKDKHLSSKRIGSHFAGTENFEEAIKLFKYGWPDGSKNLTKKLNDSSISIKPTMKSRTQKNVAGYQVLVPNYLSGDPLNMINRKMVPVKQKVITISKSISYNAFVEKETIENESVKAMQIAKKIESQGIRVNLNLIFGATKNNMTILVKIRLKKSTEKVNVSKLAFPLVHPSMLRRLLFRFEEVVPGIDPAFCYGYGTPMQANEMKTYLEKDEYLIPPIFGKDVEDVKSLEDL